MSAVIVMAKECVPGRVKTRLSPPFTPGEAARIAAASLADTLSAVRRMPVERRILAFDGHPDFDTSGFSVRPQVSGSLDERIAAALDDCAEPVLLIGMDTPHLRPTDLDPVFRSWDSGAPEDAWLGMADDGGYWALAMRTPSGAAVRSVPMSRSDTGSRQRDRLEHLGYRVRDLPTRTDIDDIQSLRRALPDAPPDGRLHALFTAPDADAAFRTRIAAA